MENILMTFFWICVISANLLANSQPLSDAKISFMQQYVKCVSLNLSVLSRPVLMPRSQRKLPNQHFFSLSLTQALCVTNALDCCLKELDGEIRKQCDNPHDYISDAVEFLNKTIGKWKASHPLTNSSQCACERWPKTPLRGFLNNMKSLLQLLKNMPPPKSSTNASVGRKRRDTEIDSSGHKVFFTGVKIFD
ncbi:uncharacterized protein LOC144058778 [Vanacampus margaritifer]